MSEKETQRRGIGPATLLKWGLIAMVLGVFVGTALSMVL
jgi:hypothetical protein